MPLDHGCWFDQHRGPVAKSVKPQPEDVAERRPQVPMRRGCDESRETRAERIVMVPRWRESLETFTILLSKHAQLSKHASEKFSGDLE